MMKKTKTGSRRILSFLLAVAFILLQTACAGYVPEEPRQDSGYESFAETFAETAESSTAAQSESFEAVGSSNAGGDAGESGQTKGTGQAAENGQTVGSVAAAEVPEEDGFYYDLEHVVLYLYYYDRLPDNYITKKQARELGWQGGSVEVYQEGAAIGGDRFGNREGLLPEADGRTYTECDIDTLGKDERGAQRLIFSNDGLYFYTEDHYETFEEIIVDENGEVAFR